MKDVSIIIPVWNAGGLLPTCLDSIVDQTWDHERIEVILVDDGSTDGSGDVCDDYARRHSMFRVIHQSNSGGPAEPRNKAIEIATGDYLFFCDNDDYFGSEAVERMVGHARAWGSDILLVKMGQAGGRDIPRRVFEQEQPKADLYASAVTTTLGPWKLYRRSLIVDNGIRFPEDCSFDDSVFTLHAMLLAETISVANDYEYYYWVLRSDGGNITTGEVESAWHSMDRRLCGLKRLATLVDDLGDPQKAPANLLPKLLGEPFAATVRMLPRYEWTIANRWADELRVLVGGHYSPSIADELRFDVQLMFGTLLQTTGTDNLRVMVSAMPGVPETTTFVEENGLVYCHYLTTGAEPVLVRFPLGPKTLGSILVSRNTLTSASWDHGSLTLRGTLTVIAGRDLGNFQLMLAIRDHAEKDRAGTVPAQANGNTQRAIAGARLTSHAIEWECVIGPGDLYALSAVGSTVGSSGGVHRWDLELVLLAESEQRTMRIGADRKPGVFSAFTRGAAASSTSLFLPDETGMKNLSIWEVTADADLSRFRVKKGRPPANGELLARLSRHDFGGALSLAKTVQAGRFNPRAGRVRRLGRLGLSRLKSLARRLRSRARKHLRRR